MHKFIVDTTSLDVLYVLWNTTQPVEQDQTKRLLKLLNIYKNYNLNVGMKHSST